MENSLKNICICGDGISLIHEEGNILRSRVLDSGESGNIWHRLSISFKRERGVMFRVSIYASDSRILNYNNRSKTIDDVLSLSEGEEKNGFLAKSHIKTCENPSDVLLHDIKGRFLWCRIEVSDIKGVTFDFITVSTPAQTFLKYLPEIYQKEIQNSFLDRYLSVFQTVYEDFESEIFHSGALYDADSAPPGFIAEMAGWFSVGDILLWTPEQLRAVLKNAYRLHKARGTIEALSLIIEIFCGAKAYFTETFHAMRYYAAFPGLRRLYSADRLTLWIEVFKELSDREETVLRHLIEQNKPAHINAKLIVLKPSIILDWYSYIGINSIASEFSQAGLNGQSMLGYGVL